MTNQEVINRGYLDFLLKADELYIKMSEEAEANPADYENAAPGDVYVWLLEGM